MVPGRWRVYAFVAEFVRQNGYSPTLREIGAGVGLTLSTVASHVARLIADGKLTGVPRAPRTLRPADPDRGRDRFSWSQADVSWQG